jgi:hypothetical protein
VTGDMEHAEARELLEIAAVEPSGFERLAAGDTPEAAALAGHIAGCLECAAEMERLRRASIVIRDAVRMAPPPELRERTLAFVAAVGRPRGQGTADSAALAAGQGSTASAPIELDRGRGSRRAGRRVGLWPAAIAAVVALAVVGTSIFVARSRDSVIDTQAIQIASLAKAATWSLRIDARPDASYVELAGTNGAPDVTGTLAFSPGTKELVVLAEGLTQPPPEMQYRCWVEIGGQRMRIGQMFFGGGISYWVGAADEVAGAGPGTRFGVSLERSDGDTVTGDPVLLGEL